MEASKLARPKLKAIRPQEPIHITADEADVLISMRREKERRVPLAEMLRKHPSNLIPRGVE